MTQRLGSQTIAVGTTQIFNAPSMGIKGLIIDNASPFVLNVRMEGSAINKSLQPAGTDFFPVSQGFNGNVVYSSQAQLTNPQSYTNYTLTVDAVGLTENFDSSQYPVARPQAAVSPTATGQPIFSATVGFGSTAATEQHLNVFNPQNSGVSYQFHSARFFTSGNAAGAACYLTLNTGADLNLSTPVPVVSHDAGSNPPTSQAHATAADSTSPALGTQIEVYDSQQNVTLDFLAFPDQVILRPGNNLRLTMVGGVIGLVTRLTMKWTEVPQIASTSTGGATTGNILTAANVVNTGNPAGTGIITAQPSGDVNNAVFMDNAGNATFGDAAHAGTITVKNGSGTSFSVDASGNVTAAGNASITGNETVTGSITTPTGLVANLITAQNANDLAHHVGNGQRVVDTINGTDTFSVNGNGANLLAGTLKLLVGSVSRISFFTAAVTTTSANFAHGLGVLPDIILFCPTGGVSTVRTVNWNNGASDATNANLTGSASFTAFCLAIKF